MADPGSELVIQRINRYIDATYKPSFTIAENLDAAQVRAMNDRKGSHDTEGRDAEYYLKARSMVSKSEYLLVKDIKGGGGVALSHAYNFFKLLYICAGLEEYARTDPDVMVSPPGGTEWVRKGADDAMAEDGSAVAKPKHASQWGMVYSAPTI